MLTIFDTETTGLLLPKGNPLSLQPYITEIYAAQLNDDLEIVREFESLVKPPVSLSKKITEITGLTDDDLKNAPTFKEIYEDLLSVFWGSHTVIAHNLQFDERMLINELKRIGKVYAFPYPPRKFCTVEQTMHLKGRRIKNNELYFLATGKELVNAHRAKNDVMALLESYKWVAAQQQP